MSGEASALSAVELPDDQGRVSRLGDFWRERPVVLAFLRHWG